MIFQKYASFYDLLYRDKQYEKECDFIINNLNQIAPKANKILELGCGTGKHARLLAKSGYQIHGIEKSQNMIDMGLANQNDSLKNFYPTGGFFVCQQGDALTTNVGTDFDAALSLFHVLSYQNQDSQVIKLLRNINKHLKIGGFLILDFWYSPAVHHIVPETRVKRVSNETISVIRIAEPNYSPNSNIIDVNYLTFEEILSSGDIRKTEECHTMRAFDLDEIDEFAKLCGFDLLRSSGWMDNSSVCTKTWSVYSILQKKNDEGIT